MQLISNPRNLKTQTELKALSPFGLGISARRELNLEQVDVAFLERILSVEKLVLLRGFKNLSGTELLNICKRFSNGTVLEWEHGAIMEMKEVPENPNYLFSSERVPFHWDGAFHREPHFLVFHCIEAPSDIQGGQTLFTNTELMFQNATRSECEEWSKVKLRYETKKLAHYGGVIRVELLQKHPITKAPILRYAESVETELNPVSLTVEGISSERVPRFISEMKERIYSREYCYEHQWKTGDVLIADNHSLIHGRAGFLSGSPRHLRRIQVM